MKILTLIIVVIICVCFSVGVYFIIESDDVGRKQRSVDNWAIKSYHYIIELQDDDWIEVRHSDGTIVGQVRVDTSSQLGKLFIKDNQ